MELNGTLSPFPSTIHFYTRIQRAKRKTVRANATKDRLLLTHDFADPSLISERVLPAEHQQHEAKQIPMLYREATESDFKRVDGERK